MALLAAIYFPLAALLVFGFPPIVFWCYCEGSVILLLGLIVAFRRDIPRAHGLDKIVCLGPVFFVAPLAVFSGEHFTITREMTGMIPHWIPWHLFWVLFVGTALLAASFAIAAGRVAALAAALLGIMFLGFVLLLDVEGVAAHLHDRFAWTLMLRELSFSACAFALAATLANDRWWPVGRRIATAARYVVSIAVIFYGVEHFLHPQFVPVIPLEMPMPAWIPVHPLFAYGVGATEVAVGLAMLANWHARTAASLLGLVICVVVILLYLPILAAHPADIGVGMNYFADTLCFGGAVLLLAGSIPPQLRERSAVVTPIAGKLQNAE